MQTVTITVSGKVQGVFYRKYAVGKARELQLTGYIQNLENGNVYLEITGDENTVKKFIEWCYKGSPLSEVKKVDVQEISLIEFKEFTIRY